MRKIAIITPFLANGGLEKVAVVSAKELAKSFEVTLIVMDNFHVDYPYDGKMIALNVSLMNRNILKRIYNLCKATWNLWRIKKEYHFDIVISHGELANLPNIFSGGEKNILFVHGNRFANAALQDWQSRFVNKIIKYVYDFDNIFKIVTVSEGIRKDFIRNLGIKRENIMTIYNPFDMDDIEIQFDEPLGEYEKLFTSTVIVTVGRLTFQKGQWYLLRIFKELKIRNESTKLVILGDGEIRDRLASISKSLGLKTYCIFSGEILDDSYDVYFLGFQKNPFKFIRASKLFVMTSLTEGFGNTIVEAMACGCPVISTDCLSGPREIISPNAVCKKGGNEVQYGEFGILMPVFENNFVEINNKLDKKESLWVDTIHTLLNRDKLLLHYKSVGLLRARVFDRKKIINQWKYLIDGNSLYEKVK